MKIVVCIYFDPFCCRQGTFRGRKYDLPSFTRFGTLMIIGVCVSCFFLRTSLLLRHSVGIRTFLFLFGSALNLNTKRRLVNYVYIQPNAFNLLNVGFHWLIFVHMILCTQLLFSLPYVVGLLTYK